MDGYVDAAKERPLTNSNLALIVMFVANWVHRDVSTGNILFLGKDVKAQGKLSDLEYAKEFQLASPSSTDPKTVRVSQFFWYFIADPFVGYTFFHGI